MKKADLIIIVSVAIIVGVLSFFLYYVNSGSGNTVTVEKDGEIIQMLSLDEDFEKQYDFDGETNTLIIKDGKAMVTEANCPDGICANHKPISRAGESIICLPHKLVITVSNDKTEDNEIDAVA